MIDASKLMPGDVILTYGEFRTFEAPDVALVE